MPKQIITSSSASTGSRLGAAVEPVSQIAQRVFVLIDRRRFAAKTLLRYSMTVGSLSCYVLLLAVMGSRALQRKLYSDSSTIVEFL